MEKRLSKEKQKLQEQKAISAQIQMSTCFRLVG